jgi:hypothetical protein
VATHLLLTKVERPTLAEVYISPCPECGYGGLTKANTISLCRRTHKKQHLEHNPQCSRAKTAVNKSEKL